MTVLVLALLLQADLIEKFGADELDVRDATERELLKLGEKALPALRKALEVEKEAEPKARLLAIIAKIDRPRRYGRGATDWSARLDVIPPKFEIPRLLDEGIHPDDSKHGHVRQPGYVELRGDGTGVHVVPQGGVLLLSLTRAQLDAIADAALEADLLDRVYDLGPPERGLVEERRRLTFRSGHEHAEVVLPADLQVPKRLKALVRELYRMFSESGESIETVIEALEGRDADAAEKKLRGVGKPAVRALKAERERAEGKHRERLDRLIEELDK